MSPQRPVASAATQPGPSHARALQEARARQLALIAIAAGNAAARRPPATVTLAPAPVAETPAEPLSEERRQRRARIRKLGICLPVDPDAPARELGRPRLTPP